MKVGDLLTYSQVANGTLTYDNWIDGIAKGRTVISRSGHTEFLALTANSTAVPGDEIDLASGGSVPVTVKWTTTGTLTGTIELVSNGVVVASRQGTASATAPLTLTATVDFSKSGWLAARRIDSSGRRKLHTAGVFVIVNGAPIRASQADAQFFVDWIDNLIQKTSVGGAWSSYYPTSRADAQARFQAAKAIYQQIAAEAAASGGSGTAAAANGTRGLTPAQAEEAAIKTEGPGVKKANGPAIKK